MELNWEHLNWEHDYVESARLTDGLILQVLKLTDGMWNWEVLDTTEEDEEGWLDHSKRVAKGYSDSRQDACVQADINARLYRVH